ncbi:phosphoenolpyruvate--protein phosphotransferase [Candidatus Hodarchaeum mangrovi]
MEQFIGKSLSKKSVIGPCFIYTKKEIRINDEKIPSEEVEQELLKLQSTLDNAETHYKRFTKDFVEEETSEICEIFNALKMVLKDPKFISKATSEIQDNHHTTEYAVETVLEEYARMIEGISDPYLQQRASDIRDIKIFLLELLSGEFSSQRIPKRPSIVIANDLFVTDLARIGRKNILGIVLENGTFTSHLSIVVKSMGIPLLIECNAILSQIQTDTLSIIDGEEGKLIIDPTQEIIDHIKEIITRNLEMEEYLKQISGDEAITKDGRRIIVAGNAANLDEVENTIKNGGEGIGLFRTELLYTELPSLPTQEALIRIFQKVSQKCQPYDVIIRTLDLGSDKSIPSLPLEKEPNPALGVRGIRLTNDHPELMETMIRAFILANEEKNLKIMVPMISLIEEIQAINLIVMKIKEELNYKDELSIGIMIETPSAAVLSDKFIRYVDFFSIGTNDLTQYVMAADRINPNVSIFHSHFQPSVLRLIREVVINAHKEKKWVGICGEMASNFTSIPILIGLGIDELSLNPEDIPKVKFVVKQLSYQELQGWVENLLTLENPFDIQEQARKKLDEYIEPSKRCFF